MRFARSLWVGTLLALPRLVAAQGPDARVVEGDRLYDAREPARALAAYESAIAAEPGAYEPLWKAARSATDLGEFEPVDHTREAYFTRARDYAQRAVKANTGDAEGYFQLARAVGRVALSSGPKERVRLAGEVRAYTLDALSRKADHPGALHVLGVWNAEIMRLNMFERVMAKTFLGGKVLGEASWNAATQNLERSVAVEPERIVHRLDLGRVYKDTGKKDLARAAFEWIARAPVRDYNDPNYKRLASEELRRIK
jgi:tetratricopeptide (TPR) repeat protein